MTSIYTFDVFSTLDGFGSYDGGDWGGYWGKQGPESKNSSTVPPYMPEPT